MSQVANAIHARFGCDHFLQSSSLPYAMTMGIVIDAELYIRLRRTPEDKYIDTYE